MNFAIVTAAVVTLSGVIPAQAQNPSPNEVIVQLTPADHSAALAAKMGAHHALPANTVAGRALRVRRFAERGPISGVSSTGRAGGTVLQYSGDVTDLGGRVLTSAVSHAIYLQRQPGGDCAIATCWGDPEGFLRDLGNSDFIHVIDQYIGLPDANRYTVGFHATVQYPSQPTPLLDSDILAFVHAVALQSGASGYGHIYHVFLPPGQDECFYVQTSEVSWSEACYSPDNPAAFYFCAYHNYADFPDIGHIIYTVQPYQNVPGCQVRPGTTNGELVDSADSVLDHETFETITDPDLDGWKNTDADYLDGVEIADECQFRVSVDGQGYWDAPTFLIGAHFYAVQLIYSNDQHACSSTASRGNL